MNKTKKLTFTALTLLIAASFLMLTAQAATTETFTVTRGTYQVTFNLPAGTAFNGSIQTTATVRVWVNDANGSLIVNLGLVDSTASFNFTAAKGGNYYVNFENPMPSQASVMFTYQTDPELPSDSNSLLPFWLLPVFVVITIVGCILILYVFRKNRNAKEQNRVYAKLVIEPVSGAAVGP